jgi:hypothetical protein
MECFAEGNEYLECSGGGGRNSSSSSSSSSSSGNNINNNGGGGSGSSNRTISIRVYNNLFPEEFTDFLFPSEFYHQRLYLIRMFS